MAIDYVLAVGCEPQRQLGPERLLALHRARILARAAHAHARASGDDRDPAEIELQLVASAPPSGGAAPDRALRLGDLFAQAAPLDAVTPHCATCPAGLPRELACHRRVRYPIPEHAEEWLMGRLPRSLDCTAGALLARGLTELGWDGVPVARLRAQGTQHLESRAPYGVRWDGGAPTASGGAVLEISSDQLLQMMFFVGPLAPTHCLMLALFCGVLPHDLPLTELRDPERRARALASAHVPPEGDPALEQLAAFLRMLAVAARLDVPILIDG
jgi:hypothetical protein